MNCLSPSILSADFSRLGEQIKELDEAGAQYALVEQDICNRNPFESLKMSYDFLKSKGFY